MLIFMMQNMPYQVNEKLIGTALLKFKVKFVGTIRKCGEGSIKLDWTGPTKNIPEQRTATGIP
jgi:hypothetical protein